MIAVRARAIQIEREHAGPGSIVPIAAAQRKRRLAPVFKFMCHGVHQAPRLVTNGFHEVFVFCLTRTAWKQLPLSPLRWHKAREPCASGLEGRAARKPIFQLLFARDSLRESANTPAPAPLYQSPPRKGSADLLPFLSSCVTAFTKRHAWLLTASMRFLFFALLERHGNSSLYPLCAGTRPVSPVHLAWRVERRGNQYSNCCSRAIH